MPRPKEDTTPRIFRLTEDTVAELDAIAAARAEDTGMRHTRTDALRFAVRQAAKKLGKKSKKTAE